MIPTSALLLSYTRSSHSPWRCRYFTRSLVAIGGDRVIESIKYPYTCTFVFTYADHPSYSTVVIRHWPDLLTKRTDHLDWQQWTTGKPEALCFFAIDFPLMHLMIRKLRLPTIASTATYVQNGTITLPQSYFCKTTSANFFAHDFKSINFHTWRKYCDLLHKWGVCVPKGRNISIPNALYQVAKQDVKWPDDELDKPSDKSLCSEMTIILNQKIYQKTI